MNFKNTTDYQLLDHKAKIPRKKILKEFIVKEVRAKIHLKRRERELAIFSDVREKAHLRVEKMLREGSPDLMKEKEQDVK